MVKKIIIIGAGQAGLSVSYFLSKERIPHSIVERGTVANSWKRNRWDSFCLVTPNWTINLPGKTYSGSDSEGFMSGEDFVKYLEDWASSFSAPVIPETEVNGISGSPGSFKLETSGGNLDASVVVVATATYQKPKIPDFSKSLPDNIDQLNAETYKSPNQIGDGSVLVVGSGQTGCQIVEDLIREDKKVYFSVSRTGRLPRRYRGRDCIEWQRDMGLLDRTPDMLDSLKDRFRGDPHVSGRDGGKTISLHDFRRKGVELLGKVRSVKGCILEVEENLRMSLDFADRFAVDFFNKVDEHISKEGLNVDPATPDEVTGFSRLTDEPIIEKRELCLREKNINTIIFATGFSYDFSWIDFPVTDEMGYPETRNGETKVEGMYFCGLNWMAKRKSGIIWGVGEDAKHVANSIVRNLNQAYV